MSRLSFTGSAGIALALLSATTFGTSGTFATALLDAGWSAGAAVTWRITIAALVLTVPGLVQLRGRWHLIRSEIVSVLTFGLLAVAGCQWFYFSAVGHLSVGVALLLEYSGTLMVVVWLWVRHGHAPRRLTLSGAAMAVIGLVLVLDLTGGQNVSGVGIAYGLAAAVGLAVYYVQSAKADHELPPLVLAWAGMVVGAVALIVLDLAHALAYHAPHARVVLLHRHVSWLVPILGLAIIAAAVAYIAGIAAARLLGSKLASFVGLTEVLAAILIAWALLGQVPTEMQIAGGVCIVAGIVLVRLDEMRSPSAGTGHDAADSVLHSELRP